ncbi:MAG: DNA alkylation repair protein [Flavobacteriales bacterium]|nr:DNA alkylation repair protein [Flavobacteriales bacterium]
MKDIAPFFGLKTPLRRQLLKEHIATFGMPRVDELPDVVRSAYACEEREMHYVAMDLLVKVAKKLGPEHLPLLEELITTHSWWDTVDAYAANVVGVILKKHPQTIGDWNERWIRSSDMWLNRTAILFQLKWKQDTDEEMLFSNCAQHAAHSDFFIRKAIGWALRAYAETAPEAVQAFVATHTLSPLSKREALRKL